MSNITLVEAINLALARAMEEDDDCFEEEHEEEGSSEPGGDPVDARRDHKDREEKSEPADGLTGELERRLRPVDELLGVDGCLEGFAGDCHGFAEVETIAKIGDGAVPLVDGIEGCGAKEPVGEGVLTHAGSGDGEKFEEAAAAEEIEVGGVEMFGGVEAVSGGAMALPLVLDAGEAETVELYGSLGDGLFLQELRVIGGDGDEEDDGQRKPDGGKGVGLEVDPDECDQDGDEEKAEIAEADVNGFQVLDAELAIVQPLPVVLGWRDGLRHRAIITR